MTGSERREVVLVGAGIAGLLAAGELCHTHDVVVVDKGRGVGGRLATRRIGDATIDHGAQFLTTHTVRFAELVAAWQSSGVVEEWYRGRVGPAGTTPSEDLHGGDGHARFRGRVSMNAIAKHLAEGIEVRRGERVTAVARAGPDWRLSVEGGADITAAVVVLTAPVPQSLALLDAGGVELDPADRLSLDRIEYDPCLAVLAPLTGPSGLPEPGAVDPAEGPIDWMADNRRKGISATDAVTIHATPEFSREHWGAPDDEVIAALLAAADLDSPPIAGSTGIQRWRYATPVVRHPAGCLVASGVPPLVFGGDAFGGAKVEGAALSGVAVADALRELLT